MDRILPLTTLFTPGTLSVKRAVFTDIITMEVLRPGIFNNSKVDFYFRNGITPSYKRLITAVAITGQVMPPPAPGPQPNMSYALQTFAPLLRCNPANSSMQAVLQSFVQKSIIPDPAEQYDTRILSLSNTSWIFPQSPGSKYAKLEVGYYGAVPMYQGSNISQSTSIGSWAMTQSTPFPEQGTQSQLLFGVNNGKSGLEITECQLYNASITFNLVFTNRVGSFQNTTKEWLNRIHAPYEDASQPKPETVSQISLNLTKATSESTISAGLFMEISNYVTGSITRHFEIQPSVLAQDPGLPLEYLEEDADFLESSLVDIPEMSGLMNRLAMNTTLAAICPLTSNRRNITLGEAVEELSLNATLSILHEPALW